MSRAAAAPGRRGAVRPVGGPEGPAGGARIAGAAALVLAAGASLACAEHMSRPDLAARLAAGDPPAMVDVRSEAEYREARVPGAVHIPFYALLSRRERIPDAGGEPLVLYCEHGPRAGIARAQLWIAGIGPVLFLEGHMSAWKADGLPVASGPPE